MRFAAVALLLILPFVSACNDTPTEPTTPTTPTYRLELFSGSLDPGATMFYSYPVTVSGTVSVMLATVTGADGQPLGQSLKLGVGVPNGTDCGVTTEVTVGASLTSQLSNFTTPGTYCVNVADPGTLTAAASFNIRIVHP